MSFVNGEPIGGSSVEGTGISNPLNVRVNRHKTIA